MKMKLSSLLIPAILCLILTFKPEIKAEEITIRDIIAARDWCDRNMLHRIEGIWEFPDDETTVLIKRSNVRPQYYEIVTVSSPDTRLKPGDVAGYLKESAESNKFEMALYRDRMNDVLAEPAKCLAQLTENDNAIVAKGRKIKFSLKSNRLLPLFWRMIHLTVKDPLENLPKGLIRVYPSSSRNPDYL